MPHSEKDIIREWCNDCGRETDHEVVYVAVLDKVFEGNRACQTQSVTVRCRGCGEVSSRNEIWDLYYETLDDEPVGERLIEFTISPPRLWRRLPDWLPRLEPAEPDLCDLLREVYRATHDGQVRLLASGVRTSLDYVMTKIVGDVGEFSAKLTAMQAAGHLSATQRDMLETVIDVGSAAVHRGFKPQRELLEEMLITMETIIRDHYLTGPALRSMKTLVPPRPPRAAKPPKP